MILKHIPRLTVFILCALIVLGTVTAIAASNTVSASNMDEQNTPLPTVNDKKPAECSALNLTAIYECPSDGGICNATDESELIIGSPFGDEIYGGKGNDCILGGDGDDIIHGEQGKDDVCFGGLGSDTFANPKCETTIDP